MTINKVAHSSLLILCVCSAWSFAVSSPAQTVDGKPSAVERFTFGGLCVPDGGGMPEVIRLDTGGYRMYYSKEQPHDIDQIKYADSEDGIKWTIKGVVIQGSSNPADRTYQINGPSIVRLPDKRYRLYYVASPEPVAGIPEFHVRSAISDDGITFRDEPGIRIEIQKYDPKSPVTLAGHGTFFHSSNGLYVAIFSADPAVNPTAGSDLMMATSADGLVWGNYKVIYADFHDPVVINKQGTYYLYAMYMDQYFARTMSADGITWSGSMEEIEMTDAKGVPFGGDIIGDLGGTLDPSGEIRLYSNYTKTTPTDIAYFRKENPQSRKKDLIGSWANQGVYYRNSDTGAWTYITTAASQLASGDIDGDGMDDLVATWPGSGLWVRYTGSGQWTRISASPSGFALGDTNGDHRADILGIWQSLVWARDSASGSWTALFPGASQIASGDFDGDGKADFAGIWPGSGIWIQHTINGQWTFHGSAPDAITCGDLNGDGKSELIGIWQANVWVLDLTTASWTFLISGPSQVAAGDLDGDGKDDLVCIWPNSGVWVKYSSTDSWVKLAATADWMTTGRLR
jgi:hypothetical protein